MLSQVQSQSQLKFPTDKEEAGRAGWVAIFNRASQLPDVLDRSDRVAFSRFVGDIVRSLPCEDCRLHSFGYFKAHPPSFNTRGEAVDYFCEFKNDVRRRQGKSTMNCSSIKVDGTCPTCGTNHTTTEQTSTDIPQEPEQQHEEPQPQTHIPTENQEPQEQSQPQPSQTKQIEQESIEVEPDLSEDFESYKQIQTRMFENLCKKENVPTPPIFHSPCPEHENTSCVRKNNETGSFEVYLHPGTTDNRQRIHEFRHYLKLFKGEETSEEDADKYALDILQNHFPLDKPTEAKPAKVYADSSKSESKSKFKEDPPNFDNIKKDADKLITESTKKAKDEWTTYTDAITGQYIPTVQNDPILAITAANPYTQQVQMEVQQRQLQEEERKKQEESGLFANLDTVYRVPAGFLGLTPQEMNNINTPNIIKSAVMTLVGSNLTPFGSAIFTFALGVILFMGAMFAKSRMSHRDIFGIAALSAAFTWNTMEYLNPKLHVKTTLMDVFKKKARLRDLFIETPKMRYMRESTPQILPIPHTAFMRTFATGAGPSDISTIRIRQNESKSRFDASRPAYSPQSGRGLLPAEERAVAMPLNAGPGNMYDIPSNPGVDLYSEDYGDDVYSQSVAYTPSNPALQQIAVIDDGGPSGY